MEPTRLYTVPDLVGILGCHENTVYRMLNNGTLTGFQLGGDKGSWRVTDVALAAYMGTSSSDGDDA